MSSTNLSENASCLHQLVFSLAIVLIPACSDSSTCEMAAEPQLTPIPTSAGQLQFTTYDAGFDISSGADACVGFAKVELFGNIDNGDPQTGCRLRFSTSTGEPGEKRAPLFSAVLDIAEGCDAAPATVRGEYRLQDASQSYIELLGNPESVDFGGLCARAGMMVHIEGTLVRDPEPPVASSVDPEIVLTPTDVRVPGDILGARDETACSS